MRKTNEKRKTVIFSDGCSLANYISHMVSGLAVVNSPCDGYSKNVSSFPGAVARLNKYAVLQNEKS